MHVARKVEILEISERLQKKKEGKECLLFATTWMDLKDIMPSEISQIKTNTIQFLLYVESKNKANVMQKKQMHRYRKQTGGCRRGGVEGISEIGKGD